jgi:hypothetical protein
VKEDFVPGARSFPARRIIREEVYKGAATALLELVALAAFYLPTRRPEGGADVGAEI